MDTVGSGERADTSDGSAFPGQAADGQMVDAAERCNSWARHAGDSGPGSGTKSGRGRMARRDKDGGEKHKRCAGLFGTAKLHQVVRRTGDEASANSHRSRPDTASQVNARAERRGKPGVASDNQHQPAGAADPDEIAAKSGALRFSVMAQDDAGEASRKTRSGSARVREAARISKQPKRREGGFGTSRGSIRPAKDASVHGFSSLACATRAAVLTS